MGSKKKEQEIKKGIKIISEQNYRSYYTECKRKAKKLKECVNANTKKCEKKIKQCATHKTKKDCELIFEDDPKRIKICKSSAKETK